ncbi:MAG: Gfo/Idh/MocA family oxidoreductase [Planctomycetota bacterium]
MAAERIIPFGVIGCGLMGREFASAAARWDHLLDLEWRPRIIAACDLNASALEWFRRAVPGIRTSCDPEALLGDPAIEALYIAVPHDQHEDLYRAAIAAGKHFLGEKPFGIDRAANQRILTDLARRPDLLVRCSSEFPFFPAAQMIVRALREQRFGRILEVRCGLLHSSDLDPDKPINWKRMVARNGEYGCMGDLGMHALHIPLRAGWFPHDLRALLTKIVAERPDRTGAKVPCETWDNALLACRVGSTPADEFPLLLEMKRISPGDINTWFIEVYGTRLSARFSTRRPRTLETMPFARDQPQAWHQLDVGSASAYRSITGGIFEFGFSDAILQMWAAYGDELVHGQRAMQQPFHCVTPEETRQSHLILDAALESQRRAATIMLAR